MYISACQQLIGSVAVVHAVTAVGLALLLIWGNARMPGISVRVFMRAFGHKDIATTIKYIDASDDLVRNTVALVG